MTLDPSGKQDRVAWSRVIITHRATTRDPRLRSSSWAWSGRAQEAPRTWRLDFYETGGPGIEAYSFDRIVVEPLAWPDSPAANVDRTRGGNYRFEVLDAGGRVTFSRGYDPAFAEWVTTGRGQARAPDVPRIAALSRSRRASPRSSCSKRNARGGYDEVWRVAIDPADLFIDRSTPARQQAIEIERHGAPQTKVDVLLLGDGYTAAECSRKFRARRASHDRDALFAQRAVHVAAQRLQRLGNLSAGGAVRHLAARRPASTAASPAGATYDAFGSERYILTFENRALARDRRVGAVRVRDRAHQHRDLRRRRPLQRLLDGGRRQRLCRLSLRPRVRAPLRRARRRVLHVARRLRAAAGHRSSRGRRT